MLNIKALAFIVQKLLAKLKNFKDRSNSKVKVTRLKNVGTNGKVWPLEILMWKIKALALTVQKLLASFQKKSNSKVKVTGLKLIVPTERSYHILMWNINALALIVLKLLTRLKVSKNGSNSQVKDTGWKKILFCNSWFEADKN